MHISFDFDYTLADSSGGSIACANFALRELGFKDSGESDIRRTIGLSLERTFEALGYGSADSPIAEDCKRLFLEHAEQVMLCHIHLYSGTAQALKSLRRDGHHISIVSTKKKERIEEAVGRDGLSELIDIVIGGGCVKNNKPHPEGLERAIKELGLPIGETLYVGDSISDGECASRAGSRFIGLLSGETTRLELVKWDPVCVLSCIDEVPNFVSSLKGANT